MSKNLSTIDRVLRIALALIVGVLYFTGTIGGTLAIILGLVAVILLLTGLVGFCPLYALLNVSTLPRR
jgi:hypothetical protein